MLPHSWIEPQVMWKVQFLGFFLNKPPLFAQKDHFLRYFLNWPPPKNPYWKIEPRGSIDADMVYKTILFHLKSDNFIFSWFDSIFKFRHSVCDTLNMLNGSYICVHSKTTTLYLNQLCAGMLQHVSIFLSICMCILYTKCMCTATGK